MFLKAADPDGFAVTDGERRYPVRDGVFLIAPDARDRFRNFHEAGEVAAEVARELAELGNWPVDDDDTVFVPARSIDDVLAEQQREDDEETDPDTEPEIDTTDDELDAEAEVEPEPEAEGEPEDEDDQDDVESLEGETNDEPELEDEEQKADDPPASVTVDDLLQLSRAELNDKALQAGVENHEKLKSKTAVAEAIVATQ